MAQGAIRSVSSAAKRLFFRSAPLELKGVSVLKSYCSYDQVVISGSLLFGIIIDIVC